MREEHSGHDTDQETQYALIYDTGNGPSLPDEDEQALLRALYGEPVEGVYGGVRHGHS